MLKSLRSASQSIVAKIFFIILLGSFAFWGMGPIFQGTRVQTAAKAGDVKITTTVANEAYERQVKLLQQQYGLTVTPEMAARLGIKVNVLRQMVMQSLYDQEASKLGMRLDNALIHHTVATQPVFRDESGKFNPQKFVQFLRIMGMSENAYIYELKSDLIRTLLMGAERAGVAVPYEMAKVQYLYDKEMRTVAGYMIKAEDMKDVPQPEESDLNTLHDKNSARFETPEYRTISFIHFDKSSLQNVPTPSDDDIRSAYDSAPQSYGEPEKRDIIQITTEDEGLAKTIAEESQKTSLEKAAESHQLIARPLAGLAAGSVLPSLSDVIFKLKEGETSGVISSELGFHVIKLTKIIPPHLRTFDEAKDEIAKQLLESKNQEAFDKMTQNVEDDIGGGMKLKEVADKYHLPFENVGPVSAKGQKPDGSTIQDQPSLTDVLKAAFSIEKDENSGIVQSGEMNVVAQVDQIEPNRLKSVDEVKPELQQMWKEKKQAEKALQIAEDRAKALSDGKTDNLLSAISPFQRTGLGGKDLKEKITEAAQLDENTVKRIFEANIGDVFASQSEKGSWVIKVTAITPPSLEKADLSGLQKSMKEDVANNFLDQYGSALRSSYGTYLNEKWLNQKPESDVQ